MSLLQNFSFLSEFRSEFIQLNRTQKWLYFLLLYLLCDDVKPILFGILKRIGIDDVELANIIIVTIAVLGCIKIFVKKLKIFDVILLLIIVAFHQASAVLLPFTTEYSQNNAFHFIWACLPMYIVGLTVDKKTSPIIFVGMSYVALFLRIFAIIVSMRIGYTAEDSENGGEMMVVAYNFLPFCLFLLWYAFVRGGIYNYLMSIISVFILFSLGTRGPVICLVSFVLIYLIFCKEFKHNKIVKFFLVSVSYFFYQFSIKIAIFLSSIAIFLGVSTRIFDTYMENQLVNYSESSGRDVLYQRAIDYLTKNNVYWGEGLYSDRYMVRAGGQYVHNLELELLCSFGWIGGTIAILLLFTFIAMVFYKTRGTQAFYFLLIFFCASIIGAQFSGSFLTTPIIWFFMGMCASMQRVQQHRRMCI